MVLSPHSPGAFSRPSGLQDQTGRRRRSFHAQLTTYASRQAQSPMTPCSDSLLLAKAFDVAVDTENSLSGSVLDAVFP